MQEYARHTIGRDLEFLGEEVRGWFERNRGGGERWWEEGYKFE
jgi:hypothetical protein